MKEHYVIKIHRQSPSQNMKSEEYLNIHAYIDEKFQIRINLQHTQCPPYPSDDPADIKCDTEQGIDMDIITFYKLVDVLVGLKNKWFWESVEVNPNI